MNVTALRTSLAFGSMVIISNSSDLVMEIDSGHAYIHVFCIKCYSYVTITNMAAVRISVIVSDKIWCGQNLHPYLQVVTDNIRFVYELICITW